MARTRQSLAADTGIRRGYVAGNVLRDGSDRDWEVMDSVAGDTKS
jgi:hypothetical protein